MSESSECLSDKSLDETTLKAIEIYQSQKRLADRIWAYFSNYTALMVVLSLFLLSFGDEVVATSLDAVYWMFPAGAYAFFAIANHRSLALALDELRIVRTIATARTRRDFGRDRKASSLRFHALVIVVVLLMFSVAWVRLLLKV